jgi:Domain of unknown function (DUF4350)
VTAPPLARPDTTSRRAGPAPGVAARRLRAFALVASVVLVGAMVITAFGSTGGGGWPDPGSAAPGGTRALAELLRERGVSVTSTPDPAAVVFPPADPGRRTIVVPFPSRLTPDETASLAAAAARGDRAVVVAPSDATLARLGLPVRSTGGTARVLDRPPDCPAPAARTAGNAEVGGPTYHVATPAGVGCYPAGDASTLVVTGPIDVVGDGEFLTNARLADSGDAALALGLLGTRPSVVWVIPPGGRPGSYGAAGSGGTGLIGLLPDGVVGAISQLGVALVILALWRGRRLGPPVAEDLPVVVRASETVEGRARLYQAAHAVERAAAALRAGTRDRLADALGGTSTSGTAATGAGGTPAALVASVSAATGRSPGEIGTLLYGSGMTDDTTIGAGRPTVSRRADDGLVRLAADLDALERAVARRSSQQ